jgi:O-antigen ligase
MAMLAPFIPGVADRLGDLGKGNEVTTYAQLNSFAWRVYLWESALNSMRPLQYLIGNGLLAFRESSQEFFPLAGRVKWGAHSVFVQLIYEMGALGVASYLLVYLGVLRQLTRMLKIDKLGAFFLMVIVVNYLICAISDNMLDYLAFNWYMWFAVGAGCALVRANLPAKTKDRFHTNLNTAPGIGA